MKIQRIMQLLKNKFQKFQRMNKQNSSCETGKLTLKET